MLVPRAQETPASALVKSSICNATCADSGGSGASVPFDCGSHANNITLRPDQVACALSVCEAAECCTVVPPEVAKEQFVAALARPPPAEEWWIVKSAITFNADISAIGEQGSSEREEFEANFRAAMAATLGDGSTISADHIYIDSIVAASIEVQFHIRMPAEVEATAVSLVQSMKDSGSTLQVVVDGTILDAPTFTMLTPTSEAPVIVPPPPPGLSEDETRIAIAGAAVGFVIMLIGTLLLRGQFENSDQPFHPSVDDVVRVLLPDAENGPDETDDRQFRREKLKQRLNAPLGSGEKHAQATVAWCSDLTESGLKEDLRVTDNLDSDLADRHIKSLAQEFKHYPLVHSKLNPWYVRLLLGASSYTPHFAAFSAVVDFWLDGGTVFKELKNDPVSSGDLYYAGLLSLTISFVFGMVGTLWCVFKAKDAGGRLIDEGALKSGFDKHVWILLISATNPESLALMPWRNKLEAKRSYGGLPNARVAVFCTIAATMETVPQTVINYLYLNRKSEASDTDVGGLVIVSMIWSILTFTMHVLGRYGKACLNQKKKTGGVAVKQHLEGLAELQTRKELESMRAPERQKRALAAGVTEDELNQAYESDNPKAAIVALIISAERSKEEEEKVTLRQELEEMGHVKRVERAQEEGATADEIDQAVESDYPKEAIIALVMQCKERKKRGVTITVRPTRSLAPTRSNKQKIEQANLDDDLNADGLTPRDQQILKGRGGVRSREAYHMLNDGDLAELGIDRSARRRDKERRDAEQRALDEAQKRKDVAARKAEWNKAELKRLLDNEGKLGPEGRALLDGSVRSPGQLFALAGDKDSMTRLGLSTVDRKLLTQLAKSATFKQETKNLKALNADMKKQQKWPYSTAQVRVFAAEGKTSLKAIEETEENMRRAVLGGVSTLTRTKSQAAAQSLKTKMRAASAFQTAKQDKEDEARSPLPQMPATSTQKILDSLVHNQQKQDAAATKIQAVERGRSSRKEQLQANLKAKRAHSRTKLNSQIRADDAKLHQVLPGQHVESESDESLPDSDESLLDSDDDEPLFERTVLVKTKGDVDYVSAVCIATLPSTLRLADAEFDASIVRSYQRKGTRMKLKVRRRAVDGTLGGFESVGYKVEKAVGQLLEEALQSLASEGFAESSQLQSP
eukprot:COSAG04_NODE_299_length_17462_cov_3.686057_10_plen_1145_part_00